MTATFSVKNFDKFQHYKDRSPPWIKLYNETLDDYKFGKLPDATKAHLIAIWLLASRYNNKIPSDADWIAKRINATEPINLALLFETGFIEGDQPCSNTLAPRKQSALPETETETETEGEIEEALRASLPAPEKYPAHVLEKCVALYNDVARQYSLPQCEELGTDRRAKLKARLDECGGVNGWVKAVNKIHSSPLLKGEKGDWRANFDFMLQKSSFRKLMEGNYDGGKTNGANQKSTTKSDFEILHAVVAAKRTALAGRAGERDGGGGDDLAALPGLRENTA